MTRPSSRCSIAPSSPTSSSGSLPKVTRTRLGFCFLKTTQVSRGKLLLLPNLSTSVIRLGAEKFHLAQDEALQSLSDQLVHRLRCYGAVTSYDEESDRVHERRDRCDAGEVCLGQPADRQGQARCPGDEDFFGYLAGCQAAHLDDQGCCHCC